MSVKIIIEGSDGAELFRATTTDIDSAIDELSRWERVSTFRLKSEATDF